MIDYTYTGETPPFVWRADSILLSIRHIPRLCLTCDIYVVSNHLFIIVQS